MHVNDIHVGYYLRHMHEGSRYLTVGQGPLVSAMALTHLAPCLMVFANLRTSVVGPPSTLSKVVRDARSGDLVEAFARPININSVVGWLLLGGDHYVHAAAEAVAERGLIPPDEGRSLWFEFDRVTGGLINTGHAAAGRMEKAWTEPWPEDLVMVHFYGSQYNLGQLTEDAGVAGLSDLEGIWQGHPSR